MRKSAHDSRQIEVGITSKTVDDWKNVEEGVMNRKM